MQSWGILPQILLLGYGWTGAGAEALDSKKLWFEDLSTPTPWGRLGTLALVRALWRNGDPLCCLAQTQLNFDHTQVEYTQPSWRAWGGSDSGENILLGS